MEEAALQLDLEVGKGKVISRQEEHCKGAEGEPGCRRGLGSVLSVRGAGPACRKAFQSGLRHLPTCWRQQGARAGLSEEQ